MTFTSTSAGSRRSSSCSSLTMFRFIALAWEPTADAPAALARLLATTLLADSAWQQALKHPRLHVFLSGAVAGINQAYPLHGGRGVVVGRLFHRQAAQATTERIARSLATSDEVASTDGQALLQTYWGRYVAFFESSNGTLQVLRDPSGTFPCYMLHHAGITVIFSWLEDVLGLLQQIPIPEICRDGLAAHMAFGDLTGRRTALDGVAQVLAGECASLEPGGEPSARLAWDASDVADEHVRLEPGAAMIALRESVNTCAQAWASCYDPILLRLSGGVDSSILASCLAEGRTTSRVTCLNYHSVGATSDEREFARLAANLSRRELIELERESAFRLERVLDVARTPTPHHYIGRITSSSDAEIASLVGAMAMFTGAGGDQLFFEIRQWWPAADYLRLRGVDGGFTAASIDAAQLGKVSVWRAMRLALMDRFRKFPPPLDLHRRRSLISDRVRQQAEHPSGFVHPVFISRTRLPLGKLMQVQQLAYSAGYYDPFARERAPELVNPLLSQPLIELCLKLPTYLLAHGGRGRGLVRKAFEGEIPEAIARRRSKGGMEEHINALLDTNTDFARQMLLDGELVRRGLLDRAATEAALSSRPSPGREQVGEIHFCLAVEAWLQRWSSRQRQPS